MKSSKKAVRSRSKRDRPQNRHLRPWKKGDPNIPKSPGRPRSVWPEFEEFITEHPGMVDDYFAHPVFGKRRFHRLLDAAMQRRPVRLLDWLWKLRVYFFGNSDEF
jgi:hypothetical protein